MITNADIVKLAKVLATKEDIIEIRADIHDMRSTINSLVITVDSLVTKYDKHDLELLMIKKRLRLV